MNQDLSGFHAARRDPVQADRFFCHSNSVPSTVESIVESTSGSRALDLRPSFIDDTRSSMTPEVLPEVLRFVSHALLELSHTNQ